MMNREQHLWMVQLKVQGFVIVGDYINFVAAVAEEGTAGRRDFGMWDAGPETTLPWVALRAGLLNAG